MFIRPTAAHAGRRAALKKQLSSGREDRPVGLDLLVDCAGVF